jgi:hypothetical protein
MVTNQRIDKLFQPTGIYAGYSLIIFGAIGTYYSLTGLILAAAGIFMAYTCTGSSIDYEKRRIRSYTSLFGFIKTGRWHDAGSFTRFMIYKSRRSYTTYSRANVPFTLTNSDIRLAFLNDSGSLKVIINKYGSFEAARNHMTEIIRKLNITGLKEWL